MADVAETTPVTTSNGAGSESFSDSFDLSYPDAEIDAITSPEAQITVDDDPEDPNAAPDETPQPEVEQPAEKPDEAKPEEESSEEPEPGAPEDEIKERTTARGKKEYVLRETQFQKLRGRDQVLRKFEEMIGAPVTEETFQDLHTGAAQHDAMITDWITGDQRFLQGLYQLSREALENGDVSTDPLLAHAQQLPDFLAKNHPRAYEEQQTAYLRDSLDALYEEAAQSGNKDLLAAAQWIDRHRFGSFRKAGEVAAPDPLKRREAELTAREKEINARIQREEAERWNGWNRRMNEGVRSVRSEEITSVLKGIEQYYKDHPDGQHTLNGLSAQLKELAQKAIDKDERWLDGQRDLIRKARQATSEQRRADLLQQLLDRERAKVKTILDLSYNEEVRNIVSTGAKAAKARNDATHQRARAAENRREPGAGGTPVPKSIVPVAPKGLSARDEIAWELDRMFKE